MRRNRIVYFLIWVASVVGISLYGGNISYGLFTVLTLLPVICLLYLACVYFCFRIYQELNGNRLVANETVPFFFRLINEFFFGFVGIRVRFFSSFSEITGLDDAIEYELFPGKGINLETSLVCKYRGEYEIGIKTVELQDFLRLFKISYRNPETLRVAVRPPLVYLEELKSLDKATLPVSRQSKGETQQDVLVREYLPGDDIRRMHWNSTAATGKLMVRQQTGETKQGVGIVLDTRRISKKQEEYLPVEHKLLEATLALSLYFAGKQVSVQSYYFQNQLKTYPVEQMAQFDGFYDAMSAVEFREEYSQEHLFGALVQSGEIFEHETVFLVLSDWSSEAEMLLQQLAGQQVFVVVYLFTDSVEEKTIQPDDHFARTQIVVLDTKANLTEVM